MSHTMTKKRRSGLDTYLEKLERAERIRAIDRQLSHRDLDRISRMILNPYSPTIAELSIYNLRKPS